MLPGISKDPVRSAVKEAGPLRSPPARSTDAVVIGCEGNIDIEESTLESCIPGNAM